MNKNKKGILLLVVLFIVIYIIISILISIPKGKKYKNTVFIGSNTKVNINNGIITVNNDNSELIKQKVKTFFKKDFIDGYISSETGDTYGVVYNVYDLDGNILLPDSSVIAHTLDISIKVKDSNAFESRELDDIYSFAKSSNITLPSDIQLDYLNITTFDLYDDGNEESIYSFGLIEDQTEYSSFVYLKKDNKYYLIDREESNYDGVSNVRLHFLKLIDFNNDGNYEFVVEKMMSEYGPYYYELFNFDGKSFTKIGGE